MPTVTEIVRTTCPRDCYDGCGILVVKRDGVVRFVRGDPDHHVSRGKPYRACNWVAGNGRTRTGQLIPIRVDVDSLGDNKITHYQSNRTGTKSQRQRGLV
jgi:ribosomal protein L24E